MGVDVLVDRLAGVAQMEVVNVLGDAVQECGVCGHHREGRDVLHCEVESAGVVTDHLASHLPVSLRHLVPVFVEDEDWPQGVPVLQETVEEHVVEPDEDLSDEESLVRVGPDEDLHVPGEVTALQGRHGLQGEERLGGVVSVIHGLGDQTVGKLHSVQGEGGDGLHALDLLLDVEVEAAHQDGELVAQPARLVRLPVVEGGSQGRHPALSDDPVEQALI